MIHGLQHHAEARNEAHEHSPSKDVLVLSGSGWQLGQGRRDTAKALAVVQPLWQAQNDDDDKAMAIRVSTRTHFENRISRH
ncbi:hypothetical protein MRX96_028884 [Rhipicephalus microplus]